MGFDPARITLYDACIFLRGIIIHNTSISCYSIRNTQNGPKKHNQQTPTYFTSTPKFKFFQTLTPKKQNKTKKTKEFEPLKIMVKHNIRVPINQEIIE
jgi:hypothetical protein